MSRTAEAYTAYVSHAWGNLLSEFWEVRATAALWGKSFETRNIDTWQGTWLRYLPQQAPPTEEYTDWKALHQICEATCKRENPMFPHMCTGSWTHIRGLIINETQSALLAYSQQEDTALPGHSPGDVLVHLRFELEHEQMSWPGRSFFEAQVASRHTFGLLVWLCSNSRLTSVPLELGPNPHKEGPPSYKQSYEGPKLGYKYFKLGDKSLNYS